MAREHVARPAPIGARGGLLLGLLALGGLGYWYLGLGLAELVPSEGGLGVVLRFIGQALSPALSHEAEFVPAGASPLLWNAVEAAGVTVVFAAAAMSLALVLGLVLGFLASASWWAGDPVGGRSPVTMWLRRTVAPVVHGCTRALIAFMRSIHELLWAILFLAAFGLNDFAAVLAIALPYGGTLAKIFSEMIDDAPRDAGHALRGAGATGPQVFLHGLVSRAVPDMTAYTFYRFECALRSSAVLGFFGFETLGLYIRQSFRSAHYAEVWTYLYVLVAMIIVFDWWSGALRRRIVDPPGQAAGGASATARGQAVAELWRVRPRDYFVRCSLMVFGVTLAASWVVGGIDLGDAFSAQRLANFERFMGEVTPYPLQGVAWDWGVASGWAGQLLEDRGSAAILSTLAISLLAIVLASGFSLILALPAARSFATPEPFVPGGRTPSRWSVSAWATAVVVTRLLLILLRALPEYVWAFLLVAILGPTAWPAVLALAIHNAGILGRLNAETVENTDAGPLRALRSLGARRPQLAIVGLFPAVFPRTLMYFFYRWETCVREATVLGMLGVVSLGYWIDDARTRGQHDTMLFFVLLGSLIVIGGDLVSAGARRLVRAAA